MNQQIDARTIDKHVGSRLRQQRQLIGYSQTELGDRINVTFQQVQKYETGANRISASKLYQLAILLNVEIKYFFDGLPNNFRGVAHPEKLDLMLMGQLQSIRNKELKQKMISLVQSFAEKEK